MRAVEYAIVVAIVAIVAALFTYGVVCIAKGGNFMQECRADGYSEFQCKQILNGYSLPAREKP